VHPDGVMQRTQYSCNAEQDAAQQTTRQGSAPVTRCDANGNSSGSWRQPLCLRQMTSTTELCKAVIARLLLLPPTLSFIDSAGKSRSNLLSLPSAQSSA
jgi:hypothetical protein